MSAPPNPPVRVLAKNIQWPSGENAETKSSDVVLIGAGRRIGAPQGAPIVARCETQMSRRPKLPVRSEVKYRLKLSAESDGPVSLSGELTTGPSHTGVDQPE